MAENVIWQVFRDGRPFLFALKLFGKKFNQNLLKLYPKA